MKVKDHPYYLPYFKTGGGLFLASIDKDMCAGHVPGEGECVYVEIQDSDGKFLFVEAVQKGGE